MNQNNSNWASYDLIYLKNNINNPTAALAFALGKSISEVEDKKNEILANEVIQQKEQDNRDINLVRQLSKSQIHYVKSNYKNIKYFDLAKTLNVTMNDIIRLVSIIKNNPQKLNEFQLMAVELNNKQTQTDNMNPNIVFANPADEKAVENSNSKYNLLGKAWSKEDDTYLMENKDVISRQEMMKKLDRTYRSIENRIYILNKRGFTAKKEVIKENTKNKKRVWSEEDLQFVLDNMGKINYKEMGKKLNRSHHAIATQVFLQLKKKKAINNDNVNEVAFDEDKGQLLTVSKRDLDNLLSTVRFSQLDWTRFNMLFNIPDMDVKDRVAFQYNVILEIVNNQMDLVEGQKLLVESKNKQPEKQVLKQPKVAVDVYKLLNNG